MKKSSKNYHAYLIESLKKPDAAIAYLKAALDEVSSPELFLLAIRNVAEARGFRQLSKTTRLNRENLYRMLSKKGNPEFGSLWTVLDALGVKLSVELKKAS